MSEWINIKDKENEPVVNETILLTDGREVYSGFLDSELEYRLSSQDSCEDIDFFVTHWMQFPEPPK